jgi:hypothetical protein
MDNFLLSNNEDQQLLENKANSAKLGLSFTKPVSNFKYSTVWYSSPSQQAVKREESKDRAAKKWKVAQNKKFNLFAWGGKMWRTFLKNTKICFHRNQWNYLNLVFMIFFFFFKGITYNSVPKLDTYLAWIY